MTLEQLLDDIAQACRGDARLGEQLWRLVQQMAGDSNQPPAIRALGRVLQHILEGEREPELAALPLELVGAVRQMLDSLRGE